MTHADERFVSIKSLHNNKWICADEKMFGKEILVPRSDNPDGWEKFKLVM